MQSKKFLVMSSQLILLASQLLSNASNLLGWYFGVGIFFFENSASLFFQLLIPQRNTDYPLVGFDFHSSHFLGT